MLSTILLSVLLVNSTFATLWHSHKFQNTPRIYGGKEAQSNQFPYMVSLRQLKSTANGHLEYSHFCGAALIGHRWVISAAHCLRGKRLNVSHIGIIVGAHHFSQDGQIYKVEQIIRHNGFDEVTKINDISLLQTVSFVSYNDKVQPIPISKEWISAGQQGLFAGFGVSDSGFPQYLKYILLSVISNDECTDMHVTKNKRLIHDSVFCTFVGLGSGTAGGDSGGVLAVNGHLAGILSWGIPGAKGKPEQFTRISNFTNWIEEQTDIKVV